MPRAHAGRTFDSLSGRPPGFTVAVVLTVALGLGATTTIFSVVHAVILSSAGSGQDNNESSGQGRPHSDILDAPRQGSLE